jgi:hypothetical protein
MRYVISYDLMAPEKNYQPLGDALASAGAKRVLLSQWVVRWNSTNAVTICEWVRTFIDPNDRVLVACLDSNDWAGWNLMVDPNNTI